MMLQSLVENAIKHGLEPKPEGGTLTISAEIVHGKLAVTVADTGLGFGKAPKQPLRPVPTRLRQRGSVDQRDDLRECAVRMPVPVPGLSRKVIMVVTVIMVMAVVMVMVMTVVVVVTVVVQRA